MRGSKLLYPNEGYDTFGFLLVSSALSENWKYGSCLEILLSISKPFVFFCETPTRSYPIKDSGEMFRYLNATEEDLG